jgi:hypothetical protein
VSAHTTLCALRDVTPVSPMARLLMLAMADAYGGDDSGAVLLGPGYVERLAAWTTQTDDAVRQGLAELESAALLVFDDALDALCGMTGGRPAWLAFVPGWEDAWEEAVWSAFGVRRQRIPDALRRAVYARDGNRCVECGRQERLSVDHIHPVARGGMTVLGNLQALCRPCNSRKGRTLAAVTA